MDELTKQVTLLGKHQIGTDEQLFSYKRSVEDESKTLTADRTHRRNEIRKVDISDEWLSAAKMKISAISERLKELRKEVKPVSYTHLDVYKRQAYTQICISKYGRK